MNTIADQYRECASTCGSNDYSNETAVRKNNAAVDKMYALVARAEAQGAEAITALAKLLNEPACAKWLSHQLVERATISKTLEDQCFRIIESKANGDGLEAMGNREWLKEWRKKKGR